MIDCNPDAVRDFLNRQCGGASEIDALFSSLSPMFQVEPLDERFTFRAVVGPPNAVQMGLKASIRLQAHCFGCGVTLAVRTRRDFDSLPPSERRELFGRADKIFNWAAASDLKRWHRLRDNVTFDEILPGAPLFLSAGLINDLSTRERASCFGIFGVALAFVILHELGHLKLQHFPDPECEFDADRFAAEVLLDAAARSTDPEQDRLIAITGVTAAQLWLCTYNIFCGSENSTTHPESFNRLFATLDFMIDRQKPAEELCGWWFLSTMLFIHMDAAGYDIGEPDRLHLQGTYREQASYLIDRISTFQRGHLETDCN